MIVIPYTVIIGNYDTLIPTKWQSVCLTDDLGTKATAGWRIRKIPKRINSSRRASRHPKMLPHVYFPEGASTLYMDGNLKLLVDPSELAEEFLAEYDIAMYSHPQRSCLFEEAEVVVRHNKAKQDLVQRQLGFYRRQGFPEQFGLTACWVILRKDTQQVRKFGELWWKIYMAFSQRDQLSFDYVRWKTGLEYCEIPGDLLYNLPENHFRRLGHVSSVE